MPSVCGPRKTAQRSKRRDATSIKALGITGRWLDGYVPEVGCLAGSRPLRSRLAEIHQFPDRTIVEAFHTHAPLELLDRDLAGEAVIGAVKADQPGDDPLEQRRAVSEDGLQDGLLALE